VVAWTLELAAEGGYYALTQQQEKLAMIHQAGGTLEESELARSETAGLAGEEVVVER
jgi:hypothetical protein